jgi:hypothetical protein
MGYTERTFGDPRPKKLRVFGVCLTLDFASQTLDAAVIIGNRGKIKIHSHHPAVSQISPVNGRLCVVFLLESTTCKPSPEASYLFRRLWHKTGEEGDP